MEKATRNEAVLDDEIAPSYDTSDDYIFAREVHANLRKSRDHLHEWKQSAKEAYDFFAGNQWDEGDVAQLREENRPVIVFNRIPRVINAIAGLELQNRQEVAYIPRTNEDLGVSDVLTDAANWVRDGCDAEDEESQSFKDCLITGLGFTETHLDYQSDPDGAIIIERIDPLDMLYDPSAVKRNLDDASWIARVRYYDRKDFEQVWPDAIDEVAMDFESDPKGMQPHNETEAPWYINDQSSNNKRDKENLVEVVQYQWWEIEPYYRVELGSGEIQELSVSEFKKRRKEIIILAKKYIRQYRKIYKQAFITGNYILEKGPCPVQRFTFRAMTGLVNHQKNIWFGLVEIMKDPQRWANKWLSQVMHILNSNAKGGYLAESDAFEDPRQAEQSLATTSITYVNEDKLDKIREKIPPGFPAGIDKLLQYAITSVSDLVGVNLEMLGMANREQSGVVEMQRKKAGITVVADFFDSLRRYRKEEGRVLAEFITEYISDGRLIRVVGKGLGEYVPLTKQKSSLKYDIIVDESPTSPDQRQMVFDRLVTLFPLINEAGIPIPEDILDYAPLPAQLIASWKEEIERSKQPDPQAQEVEQLRMRLAQAEAALKEREVSDKEAATTQKQTQSALNIAKAAHENALAELEGKKENRETVESIMNVFGGI
tara:strand:+ start:16955 stop:18922 length:1968 start_codon:yes stop_codon:yes gene_type:complete